MKDLKFKKTISGLGAADCLLCKCRQNEWMDIKQGLEGFPITCIAEETLATYNQLLTEEGGVYKFAGDYKSRGGYTCMPKATSNQHSITITHSYVNCTHWFLKLLACRLSTLG